MVGVEAPKALLEAAHQLGMAAERCVVFARIQPDQKRALVEAQGAGAMADHRGEEAVVLELEDRPDQGDRQEDPEGAEAAPGEARSN